MTTLIVCHTCDESFEVTEETRLSDPCPECGGRIANKDGIVEMQHIEGAKSNG